MKRWILAGTSAAALISGTHAGWSLTAAEAWDNWKAASASYGQTLTAESEEAGDGTLTVKGVATSAAVEDMTFAGTLDEIILTEEPDGVVAIRMSESVGLTIAGTDDEGQKIDAAMTITQQDLKITASDADGGTAFSYSTPAAAATLDRLLVDDQEIPIVLTMDFTGLGGNYVFSGGDVSSLASEAALERAEMKLDLAAPEEDGQLKLVLSVADIASSATGNGIPVLDQVDAENIFDAGLAMTVSGSFGALDFVADYKEAEVTAKVSGKSAGGHVDGEFSGERMLYDIGYNAMQVMAAGGQLPVPEVAVALESIGMRFEIPVQPTDAAAPVGIRYALEGLTLDDGVWSLIDPTGALPHDPATFVVDVSGKARWLFNIFDENNHTRDDMPGELESLELNELNVSAVGAELRGSGSFTFDNTDLETFNGMPRPAGSASFALKGGNGLLEALTNMGVVPQQQVMMVRMVMGMIAKPGAGADELTSEVSVSDDGKILVNGAPMPF